MLKIIKCVRYEEHCEPITINRIIM